jgi:hypothetical protein
LKNWTRDIGEIMAGRFSLSNMPLVLLMTLGSGLSWLPVAIEPNLDLLPFLPLAIVALCAGLSTHLNPAKWLVFIFAAGLGTFGGLCLNFAIWWPTDPIAGSFVPVAIVAFTLLALLVSLIAGLAVRRVFPSNTAWRGVAWAVLSGCVAFGPATLAITPVLVGYRIAYNDRMAAKRFRFLKTAVERTAAEAKDFSSLCNGAKLKEHYSGPAFSEENWRRITGAYVKQDGYFFMVYCRETEGYAIDARPARERGDGSRRFCTDESGKVGCRVEWNRSRNQCLPCQ